MCWCLDVKTLIVGLDVYACRWPCAWSHDVVHEKCTFTSKAVFFCFEYLAYCLRLIVFVGDRKSIVLKCIVLSWKINSNSVSSINNVCLHMYFRLQWRRMNFCRNEKYIFKMRMENVKILNDINRTRRDDSECRKLERFTVIMSNDKYRFLQLHIKRNWQTDANPTCEVASNDKKIENQFVPNIEKYAHNLSCVGRLKWKSLKTTANSNKAAAHKQNR